MKKNFFLLTIAIVVMSACQNDEVLNLSKDKQQMVTFSVHGDFDRPTFTPVSRSVCGDIIATKTTTTRAAVTADGKQMTDLWVLDYMDGVLVQQLHQTAEDEDFGEPAMALDYGQHHVYFVCSRGKTPTLSTDEHSITWESPSDTFYKDYSVTIGSGSATAHNVTLNRVATRLSVTLTDAIPEGLTTVDIEPATWYHGIDYLTGLPDDAVENSPVTISVPESRVGRTNVTLSIYSISTDAEWNTNVSITAYSDNDDIMGQAAITAAPFRANRTTAYSGNLFLSDGTFAIVLNDEWTADYNGEW